MKKVAIYLFSLLWLLISCGRSDKEEAEYIKLKMDSIKRATAIRDSIMVDSIRKDAYNTAGRRNERTYFYNHYQPDRPFRSINY